MIIQTYLKNSDARKKKAGKYLIVTKKLQNLFAELFLYVVYVSCDLAWFWCM